jgi:PTS system nitrogen regulatory IIA component
VIAVADLVTPERTLVDLRAGSKRQVLQGLADAAARTTGLDADAVLDALMQREKLGTTGVGDGVAIPHARLPGLTTLVGFVARLPKPVDFDALDGEPVDLVVLLLAPDAAGVDHLRALARIARVLRDPELRTALRAAPDRDAAYAALTRGGEPSREPGGP